MRNFFFKSIVFFASVFFYTCTIWEINLAYAGDYTEQGYITSVKANNVGPTCFLTISRDPDERYIIQRGFWDCDSTKGYNMLDVAKTAKVFAMPAYVVFEGNGDYYKPVHAVELKN